MNIAVLTTLLCLLPLCTKASLGSSVGFMGNPFLSVCCTFLNFKLLCCVSNFTFTSPRKGLKNQGLLDADADHFMHQLVI